MQSPSLSSSQQLEGSHSTISPMESNAYSLTTVDNRKHHFHVHQHILPREYRRPSYSHDATPFARHPCPRPSLQYPRARQFHFGAKNSLRASHVDKVSITTSMFASQNNQTGAPHMGSQNFSHHPHTLPHRHPSTYTLPNHLLTQI
jgi:hypothetical protein